MEEKQKHYCFLGFDNILGEQEIENLFTPEEEDTEDNTQETQEEVEPGGSEEPKGSKKNDTAEAVDPDDLFDESEEQPEVVGSEKKDVKDMEDTTTDKDSGTSPNNFYSSIASALAVDGVFPNLTEDDVKKAGDAESFSQLINDEVNARFNTQQQRILKALDNGVEPNTIKKYENTLNYIASITEQQLMEEGEQGEELRRNIIYQDFINKGYTPEKAKKHTERSIDSGNDIDDAKDALQSNREYFTHAYNDLLQEAQAKEDADRAARAKLSENMRKSLLQDKNILGDIEIDNNLRKKAFENISRPVYKDPETGGYLTAIQKYEMEHRPEFIKYMGLFYTLTNGFKDFNSFTKGKVKKEVRKGLRELEHTLNNTNRTSDGSLKMVTNAKDDPYSYIGKGVRLDI
jgi:hypothetical protein